VSNTDLSLAARAQKLSGSQKVLYGLGFIVFLAVMAPVTFFALTAITNIVMAGVVGIIGVAILMALPALKRWWRIEVLKMLKASARLNPVETLQLELLNRRRAYEQANQQSVQIIATRNALREQLDDYKQKYGASDPQLEQMVSKLSTLTDRLQTSLKQTDLNLQKFDQFVDQQAQRWKIAKQTGALATMLSAAQGGDVTDKFLADTAIDSIRNGLAQSFAEIDSILDGQEVKAALQQTPAPKMIDVTPAAREPAPAIPSRRAR